MKHNSEVMEKFSLAPFGGAGAQNNGYYLILAFNLIFILMTLPLIIKLV